MSKRDTSSNLISDRSLNAQAFFKKFGRPAIITLVRG
jgi:hypothetical protein